MSILAPHLFRKPKSAQEWTGFSTEPVPLDADTSHMFIKRHEQRLKKNMFSYYGLNVRPDRAHRRMLWSVLSGRWVPEGWLKETQIYPKSLGPLVAQELLRKVWLWRARNALLLPPTVGRALEDWDLVIVPVTCFNKTDLKVKILDPKNQNLQASVYPPDDTSGLMGWDLDDRQLTFKTDGRPALESLYFHCCCAVWKRMCIEVPEINDPDEFWELFREYLVELWGAPVVNTKLSAITEVFRPVVEEDDEQLRIKRRDEIQTRKQKTEKRTIEERKQRMTEQEFEQLMIEMDVEQEMIELEFEKEMTEKEDEQQMTGSHSKAEA